MPSTKMTKKSMKIPWLGGGFKCFLCSPLGKWSNLTSIFFRWVGSTTTYRWKWPSFRNSEACCDLMTSRRHHQWSAPIRSPTWRPWRCWAWRVAYVKGLEMLRGISSFSMTPGVWWQGTGLLELYDSIWFCIVFWGIVKWCSGDFFDLESPWIWKNVSQAWISNKTIEVQVGQFLPKSCDMPLNGFCPFKVCPTSCGGITADLSWFKNILRTLQFGDAWNSKWFSCWLLFALQGRERVLLRAWC